MGGYSRYNRWLVFFGLSRRYSPSGGWQPLGVVGDLNIDSEALTLLHALDVGLETAHELVNELVSGDILGRVDHKLFCLFLIGGLGLFVDYSGLRANGLDSLRDDFGILVLLERTLADERVVERVVVVDGVGGGVLLGGTESLTARVDDARFVGALW